MLNSCRMQKAVYRAACSAKAKKVLTQEHLPLAIQTFWGFEYDVALPSAAGDGLPMQYELAAVNRL